MLMNVADENDGHAVPVGRGKRYLGRMVTLCKPPLVRMTLAEFLKWEPSIGFVAPLRSIYRTTILANP
jgi:hypothetical protein